MCACVCVCVCVCVCACVCACGTACIPASTVVYHNSVHGTHNTHQHRGSTSSESNADAPRISQTQSFVDELMQLLRCDNEAVGVQLRETVKEMVSYELSPPVYSYLFQCMTDETLKVGLRVGIEVGVGPWVEG